VLSSGEPPSTNGRVSHFGEPFPPAPLGVPEDLSSYLQHLPGVYQESHFLGRFLLIFEHILSPVERTAGSSWSYFDPGLTPEEFLPWLGSWLGLTMDARIPIENRRAVVLAAPELWRWRGTKRGLRHFLHLFTGIEPEIVEPSLSQIATDRSAAYRFTVRMPIPAGSPITRSYIQAIVEAEKPAFTGCSIEITEPPPPPRARRSRGRRAEEQ
jgi:phage tail-like protein